MDLLPWQNCRRVKSTWHRFTVASWGEGRGRGGSEAIGTRPRYAYSERCKVRCSRVTLCPLRPRVRLRFRTRLGWTNVLILSHLALSYLRAGGNYSLQGWIGEWRIDFGGGEGVWEERNDDLRDGVGALARSECESSTRKRRSNATTTLSRAPTTRSLRVFIYTYVHARPSYNSFFLSHPLSDTLWPVSNLFSLFDSKNSLFWEISREIGRIRSLVFFFFFSFFVSSSFLLAQKRRAESTKGGERLNSMNKTRGARVRALEWNAKFRSSFFLEREEELLLLLFLFLFLLLFSSVLYSWRKEGFEFGIWNFLASIEICLSQGGGEKNLGREKDGWKYELLVKLTCIASQSLDKRGRIELKRFIFLQFELSTAFRAIFENFLSFQRGASRKFL